MRAVTQTRKPRKKKFDYEGSEQAAFMLWLRVRHRWADELCIHVPNGGSRNKIEAAKLKTQGVKAGFPDLVFFIPRHGYHGLIVEFKATPPRDAPVQQNQKQWIQRLVDQGYKAQVVRGIDELKKLFEEYINEPELHEDAA